ncbi:MAG: signal recognition particle-docking protein FtsY [Limnochordaceae bacterium]|nr:signal recognition particle-docking protein FtsY [Limnochordaceae bacterium]
MRWWGRKVTTELEQPQIPLVKPASPLATPAESAAAGGSAEPPDRPGKSWLARLRAGLNRTRQAIFAPLAELGRHGRIEPEVYDRLEEALLAADVGVTTTAALLGRLRQEVKEQGCTQTEQLLPLLRQAITAELGEVPVGLQTAAQPPTVYLFVGVNGAGKTSTIGKLAAQLRRQGQRVLVGAADTFRAAAIDQLEVWTRRAGVDLIKHQEGADPAAVAYDAVAAGKARGFDYVLIDTAGRLQNKENLMKELSKMRRVIERENQSPPAETLLVVDATTGQNGLQQARLFTEAAGVTGLVLTKLDSSAKGGIVLAIAHELHLPVKLVGVGEGLDDLQPFSPLDFAQALLPDWQVDSGADGPV